MFNFIIPFIILILVVVFIHEYGHYYFAKKYGVGVTDFSIGFGQEIFGWNDKSGTRWKICWIPLGGYVKFFGDRNVFSQADQEELLKKYNKEDQEKLFVTKPLYQRSLIVFGGPLANFLLAIVIFLSIYMFVGKDFTPAVIDEVLKDSPAEAAGLMKNDIILEIDDNKVESILDVSKYIAMSTSAQALIHSVGEVYFVTTSSLKYLASMLIGKGDSSQLGGPIRIAKISGQVAEFGIIPFLSMMAYISISLGLINLFPIPMLDGGHLMFYGFEKVLGRPLSQKTQEGFFRIGMFLLLSLMFFATFNDLKDIGLF